MRGKAARSAAPSSRTGNTENGVTLGAKNNACAVNANPDVKAQSRPRSDIRWTLGSARTMNQPNNRHAVTSGKLNVLPIAEMRQHRNRGRDPFQWPAHNRRSWRAARYHSLRPSPRSMDHAVVSPSARNGTQARMTTNSVRHCANGAGRRPPPAAEPRMGRQKQAVQATPQHEPPRRAMPEADQQHGHQQVRDTPLLDRAGCRPAGCRRNRAGTRPSVMCQRRQNALMSRA